MCGLFVWVAPMISIKIDTSGLERQLKALANDQVPYATAQALNAVAFKVKKETGPAEMRSVFDKPTPWTLRSLYVRKANKRNLRAVVGFGNDLYSKSRSSPNEILGHQLSGGGRREKGLEVWLRNAGMISAGEFVTPGSAAKLDSYGNMSRGQVMQIISQLRIGSDRNAWKSTSTRSKRSVKRAGRIFWSRGGHLHRGAWKAVGSSVVPLLIVVGQPQYKARFNLQKVVSQTVNQHFDREFKTALQRAIANPRA